MGDNEFQDWIGRAAETSDTVTARLLGEFRATLAPHLFDPERPDTAPPGFHWALAPPLPAMAALGEDGSQAKGLLVPPIPAPRRMWAGGSVESLAPIRLGASIRRHSSVAAIERRTGASGDLHFVSIRHLIEAEGILAVRERQDLVFRAAASTIGQGKAADPLAAGLDWTLDAGPVLLFRFSALTFNAHRIHYDEAFSRSEGYAGPLVQGPLQATLMLNQIATLHGQVPQRFDYRCVAPLVATAGIRIVSSGGDSRVLRPDGSITAEGCVRAPAP
ncbi:MAG: MaoC family dehydratase N-terminal domain-containing protein [Hyphomicrobiales bacterium]